MAEEPASPKSIVKSPAVDISKKELKSAEQNGSAERVEELKTPDSLEETQPEDATKPEKSDNKGSPQGGRRYGVQVMGSGLLAEMKAKQEKRAASAQKVGAGSFDFDLIEEHRRPRLFEMFSQGEESDASLCSTGVSLACDVSTYHRS